MKTIIRIIIGIIILFAGFELVSHWADAIKERNIIASYNRQATLGKVPQPENPKSIRVFRLEPGTPMDRVLVQTTSSNIWFFIKPADNSGTNWIFIER